MNERGEHRLKISLKSAEATRAQRSLLLVPLPLDRIYSDALYCKKQYAVLIL